MKHVFRNPNYILDLAIAPYGAGQGKPTGFVHQLQSAPALLWGG